VEDLVNAAFHNFYAGRQVLVTGHTGFKGGWLSLWLKQLGAEVHGFSLPAAPPPNLHEIISPVVFALETPGDIRDAQALAKAVSTSRPDIIFHLAAQSLVRRSYVEPAETFSTNAIGAMNLLEVVRKNRLGCPVIVVTSDKCYENRGWDYGYRETDPLGGHDVYSMSKAATELLVQAWRKSFFQTDPKLGPLATVRGGNVIGGGDYAPDRLVPDCVRALVEKRPIGIRHPQATRPWQHVLDCLSGYLWLGARLGTETDLAALASAFNFGPGPQSNRTVQALVQLLLQHWPGTWVDESDPAGPHEAELLHLSIDKAARALQWFPAWTFAETVRETAVWYRARHTSPAADMLAFCIDQIESFTCVAASRGIAWTKPT
jgi:CDP-glucose 4,6-dehydratase